MVGVSVLGISTVASDQAAYGVLASIPYEFVANWTWSAIPMFLLMGYVCFHSGLTNSLFDLARASLTRVPGGLAIASVAACTGFATLSGSSVATAAAMGRIAVPEMVKAGYNRNFACGTIAAGGTIGALIPPSIIMIIFGILAETSITELFRAGMRLGLLTAAGYSLVILAVSRLRPDIVPPSSGPMDVRIILVCLRRLWPILLLILGVFGGLFGGIFTATEAGAVGAALAIVIGFVKRQLSIPSLMASITDTVTTCGSIFIIGVGATMFTMFLSISGAGEFIANAVGSMVLDYWKIMLLACLIYLILGTFIDGLGALLITLPIFLPILRDTDVSLVFFGVLVTKLIEIGLVTPPFGLNVFVIKSTVGDLTSVLGIFRGVLLFIVADVIILAIMIAAPSLVVSAT
jgi:tripartite ATP-independent transporter DctM subunit